VTAFAVVVHIALAVCAAGFAVWATRGHGKFAAIVGAGLGILAVRRSLALAAVGFGAFAVAGFLASLRSPDATPTTAMIVAFVAGIGGFQVTSPNSTEVSDYGVYDTSTLGKDVTAVVNVTFSLS